MSAAWLEIAADPPSKSRLIWVCRYGSPQVALAFWVALSDEEEMSHISWCAPWLGTDQPTHWQPADPPEPPGGPPNPEGRKWKWRATWPYRDGGG